MKSNWKYLVLLILLFSGWNSAIAQQVLIKMDEGEEILYPESTFSLSNSKDSLQILTTDGNHNFYLYSVGKKEGPFSSLDDLNSKLLLKEEPPSRPEKEDRMWDGSVSTVNERDETFIHCKGKKYGPYYRVNSVYMSADGKKFVASVGILLDNETMAIQNKIVSSSFSEIVLDGEPQYLFVSPSFNKALATYSQEKVKEFDEKAQEVYMKKAEEIIAKMEKGDMLTEELTKYAQELEKLNVNEYQSDKIYFFATSNGDKLGPFKTDYFTEGNPGFGENPREDYYVFIENALYINGKKVKDFGNNVYVSKFWWSATGREYAFCTNEELVFSNGKRFPYPLNVRFYNTNGKSGLQWYSLENERNLVLYLSEF